MADYDSSLPIRTESNGDAAVKIVDGATPSNELTVESDGSHNVRMNDGTGNDLSSTSGKLDTALSDGSGNVIDSANSKLGIALNDEAGQPYTSNNPLPVALSEHEGDEVCDHQTSASVASDATTDHDYTVTAAKTFVGAMAWISGSGKLKVEIKLETGVGTDVYDTIMVGFNSTSNPNVELPMEKICGKQIAGAKIRISITNRDNQPQDLYSTLMGVEK